MVVCFNALPNAGLHGCVVACALVLQRCVTAVQATMSPSLAQHISQSINRILTSADMTVETTQVQPCLVIPRD